MLPWNYGFHWNAGTIIFMGAFYAVLTTVAVTVMMALMRTRRAFRAQRVEQIRWESDFHDLADGERACRHAFTGETPHRVCPNRFDCRTCETHARLTAQRPPAQPPESVEEIFGMPYPLDRAYHRGHTWVRREPDGTVAVGLDDLGRRMIGKPDAVELPKPGDRVAVSGTAWHARKGKARVRVLSPVDGEVVATGGPGCDWYLKVKPDKFDARHLLCGEEIRPWLTREMDRLYLALTADQASPALADGGVPVEDMPATCPEANWDAVCGTMFLEP